MTPRLSRAALCIALPFLAVPALAQSEERAEPAPATEKTQKKEETKEKKICKRISVQVGSRRKTKICRTREEWKSFNEQQRRRN